VIRTPRTVVAYVTKDGGLRLKEKGSDEAWIQSDVTMEVRR
jgi:hypothetical protein